LKELRIRTVKYDGYWVIIWEAEEKQRRIIGQSMNNKQEIVWTEETVP
jgi:hypothetical protein